MLSNVGERGRKSTQFEWAHNPSKRHKGKGLWDTNHYQKTAALAQGKAESVQEQKKAP